jgi:hypothetical protein
MRKGGGRSEQAIWADPNLVQECVQHCRLVEHDDLRGGGGESKCIGARGGGGEGGM